MIIYDPSPGWVFLRNALEQGLIDAATLAGAQFLAEANKPWAYYGGVALGGTAAATGIPGAAWTVYAAAETLDILVFKSEEGSLIDVFIDGIATAQISTYLANEVWENFVLDLGNRKQARVDFVNAGIAPGNTSGIAWMALGPFTTPDNQRVLFGDPTMPTKINFRLDDSETDVSTDVVAIYVTDGLENATLQAVADAWVTLIEAVTGSEIVSIDFVGNLAVNGQTRTEPDAGSVNERGGNITFTTTGPRREGFRIPAILPAIMSGNEFSTGNAQIAAIVTELTTGATYNTEVVNYFTPYGYAWSAAVAGKKSGRKF